MINTTYYTITQRLLISSMINTTYYNIRQQLPLDTNTTTK
jgi:hypothetical protein